LRQDPSELPIDAPRALQRRQLAAELGHQDPIAAEVTNPLPSGDSESQFEVGAGAASPFGANESLMSERRPIRGGKSQIRQRAQAAPRRPRRFAATSGGRCRQISRFSGRRARAAPRGVRS